MHAVLITHHHTADNAETPRANYKDSEQVNIARDSM